MTLLYIYDLIVDFIHEQGPYPHVDPYVSRLLAELSASTHDFWDNNGTEDHSSRQFGTIFGVILRHCSTLGSLVAAEELMNGVLSSEVPFVILLMGNVSFSINEEKLRSQ